MATAMTSDEYYQWLRERTTYEVINQAVAAGVVRYPPSYRDPDWDGTEEGFRTVRNARATALALEVTRRLAEDHAVAAPPGAPPPAPARPGTLVAAAARGDSHIWTSDLLPLTCGQVTISGLNRETHKIDSETHRLDLSMARSHDGPGRHAVWLETTLSRPWPMGTKVTAG